MKLKENLKKYCKLLEIVLENDTKGKDLILQF